MKCPNCGGEVSYKSKQCPYCGTPHIEGIRFQEDIRKKIERNKLIRPFLYLKKSPELAYKLITKLFWIFTITNVALFLFYGILITWGNREVKREVMEGSHAENYLHTFLDLDDFYKVQFVGRMTEFIECVQTGEIPDRQKLEYLIDDAYDYFYKTRDESDEIKSEADMLLKAFFLGYIGLDESMITIPEPDKYGYYNYKLDDAIMTETIAYIEQKMKEE